MTALLLAAAVGLLLGSALGLFGGGGGILAVPMLVGLLGMDIDEAATASLVIVIFGALGGLVSHHRAGRVLWRQGLLFGATSVVGATVGAMLAPRVPDWIKLGAFTLLMVAAGVAMLRNARTQPRVAPAHQPRLVDAGRRRHDHEGAPDHRGAAEADAGLADPREDPGASLIDFPAADLPVPRRHLPAEAAGSGPGGYSIPLLILLATGTGLVTGFLGVGGGFLVVPALVLSLRMPVANATATGLVVITIASASALAVRLMHADTLGEPGVTALIVVATVSASLLAARFSGRLSPRALGTGFALLVLGMSVLVASQALSAYQAHP